MNNTFMGIKYSTPFTINSRVNALTSTSDNLQTNRIWSGQQRWDFQVSFIIRDEEDIAKFYAHQNANVLGSFDLPIPQLVKFEEFGIVLVEDDYVGGDDEINITYDSDLFVGQYFNFKNPGHDKLYQILEVRDADDDDLSDVVIKIFPRLRRDVPRNTQLELNNPSCKVQYATADGIVSQTITGGVISDFTIELIERL